MRVRLCLTRTCVCVCACRVQSKALAERSDVGTFARKARVSPVTPGTGAEGVPSWNNDKLVVRRGKGLPGGVLTTV